MAVTIAHGNGCRVDHLASLLSYGLRWAGEVTGTRGKRFAATSPASSQRKSRDRLLERSPQQRAGTDHWAQQWPVSDERRSSADAREIA